MNNEILALAGEAKMRIITGQMSTWTVRRFLVELILQLPPEQREVVYQGVALRCDSEVRDYAVEAITMWGA